MTTILIADDHPIVAEGIKNVVQQSGIYHVVGVVHSSAECSSMIGELLPDILLLDVGMPDGNSLDLLPQWKKTIPTLRTLVLSCYGEPTVVQRALDNGADGYVLKDSPTECLMEGLEAVAGGKTYLCPASQEALRMESAHYEALTPREREVLALIVKGLPMKQIADRLCLSFETVHSYTKFLRAKMGVNNTAALVRKALEQRLV